MEPKELNQKPQNAAPFLSGSKKYSDHFEVIPGPGSYQPDDNSHPQRKNFPSFGTRQIRGKVFSVDPSPGPGSYEFEARNKKSISGFKKKKIIYNSSPSFPSKTVVFQTDVKPIQPAGSFLVKTKENSPLKGISFTKAPRKEVFEKKSNQKIGPGTYEVGINHKMKGGSFNRSVKKYELGFDVCKESYLQENDLTSFHVKSIPKRWQNFGNRCERIMVEIKDTVGPGHYKIAPYLKSQHFSVPFNSSDLRFRKLFT
jgi:hypothetical protein